MTVLLSRLNAAVCTFCCLMNMLEFGKMNIWHMIMSNILADHLSLVLIVKYNSVKYLERSTCYKGKFIIFLLSSSRLKVLSNFQKAFFYIIYFDTVRYHGIVGSHCLPCRLPGCHSWQGQEF